MYYSQSARLAIYAEGEFGKGHSKTAEGVIRYGKNPVVAVIDSTESGKTVEQVTGIQCQAPIVSSVEGALLYKPDALLLGTAWSGGEIPPQWRPDIIKALTSGLDIINGLHDFLADDLEISHFADIHKRRLLDVRRTPERLPIASGKAASVPATTILTVGSDCTVGKMTTALELARAAENAGFRAAFVATGQTGIMIAGEGIAIDRVIGDFMAGATEQMVLDKGFDHDFVFVEGQGSIAHPGFSGVTLALLHGACPQAMILCHKSSRKTIRETPFAILKLSQLIRLYEDVAQVIRKAHVVGIALNTSDMTESEALHEIESAEEETGLKVTDPVRFGPEKLFAAILAHREKSLDRATF